MGGAVFPPCCLTWGQTMVEVMKIIVTSFKRSQATLKRWEYESTWPASWEICMQVRKQQLELDMEQQTGSKLGKEYVKAVYYHPIYSTYMQSTLCEMPF